MTEEKYLKLKSDMAKISLATVRDLDSELKSFLDKCGLFYKCFTRIKNGNSICEKLKNRQKRGIRDYKLQDLVGVRIVVYFKSDIELCEKIISQHYEVVDIAKDNDQTDVFRPQRINYVCKLPSSIIENFDKSIWEYPFDQTFEIQIRTIFSEGWHEVEHDFRYKCKREWDDNPDLSRTLNGIFATLENCDWAIENLLDEVAYRHYKNGEWIPMLKNIFRIRLYDEKGMDEILRYFDEHREVAKKFFRLDRAVFLAQLADIQNRIPLKLNNVVYLANIMQIHDEGINNMIPDILVKMI